MHQSEASSAGDVNERGGLPPSLPPPFPCPNGASFGSSDRETRSRRRLLGPVGGREVSVHLVVELRRSKMSSAAVRKKEVESPN